MLVPHEWSVLPLDSMKEEVSPAGPSSQVVWCFRHYPAWSLPMDTTCGALIARGKCSFQSPTSKKQTNKQTRRQMNVFRRRAITRIWWACRTFDKRLCHATWRYLTFGVTEPAVLVRDVARQHNVSQRPHNHVTHSRLVRLQFRSETFPGNTWHFWSWRACSFGQRHCQIT